jgi:hypothetical protein
MVFVQAQFRHAAPLLRPSNRNAHMKSEPEPGVSLAHYRDHGAGVRLTCLDCMAARDLELETVIRRIVARGVGDAGTGINAVATYVTDPCPRCAGRRSRPRQPSLWQPPPGLANHRRESRGKPQGRTASNRPPNWWFD